MNVVAVTSVRQSVPCVWLKVPPSQEISLSPETAILLDSIKDLKIRVSDLKDRMARNATAFDSKRNQFMNKRSNDS